MKERRGWKREEEEEGEGAEEEELLDCFGGRGNANVNIPAAVQSPSSILSPLLDRPRQKRASSFSATAANSTTHSANSAND